MDEFLIMREPKQSSLNFGSQTNAALRGAQFRSRELTDGSLFPFGKNRERGLRMHEVPLTYYRWFLTEARPEFRAAWPSVEAYATALLADERAAQAKALAASKKGRAVVPRRPEEIGAPQQQRPADKSCLRKFMEENK